MASGLRATRTLDDLAVQTRILEREAAVGADHADRLASIAEQREATEARLKELNARWEKERTLVEKIREIRAQLETAAAAAANPPAAPPGGNGAAAPPAPDPVELRAQLAGLNTELETMQGDNPLMRVCVDARGAHLLAPSSYPADVGRRVEACDRQDGPVWP